MTDTKKINMKRLSIIILCIFCTSILNAKSFKYKAVSCSCCETGQSFSNWDKCNIDVYVNWDKRRIVIMSQEIQVINYTILKNIESDKNHYVREVHAIDSKDRSLLLSFSIHNDKDAFILIEYSNGKYMYKIRYIKELK